MVAAFRQGLKELGYIEGQNLSVEFRWGEGKYDRLATMAADLAHLQVAAIVATSTRGASGEGRDVDHSNYLHHRC